jgi:hypothetical protein
MNPINYSPYWHTTTIKPRLPWSRKIVRPAEVGYALTNVMLIREHHLEDANFNKIVANDYIVEVSPVNYQRNFQPIAERLLSQWREKLVESLMTANSRRGRKEFRFGGQLRIELRAASDLSDAQARILSRVGQDFEEPVPVSITETAIGQGIEVGYLELLNGTRRWKLYQGDNVIGRDESCDVQLDLPAIQELRLVSGQHAYIRCVEGKCQLFDGSPQGKPSSNGTYLNSRRVQSEGVPLKDGDKIVLAAANPDQPLEEISGAAALRFRAAKGQAGQTGPVGGRDGGRGGGTTG